MKTATRIYRVIDKTGAEPDRLVEATSPAAAIRHAAERYSADTASAKEVAEAMLKGGKVETVRIEPIAAGTAVA